MYVCAVQPSSQYIYRLSTLEIYVYTVLMCTQPATGVVWARAHVNAVVLAV